MRDGDVDARGKEVVVGVGGAVVRHEGILAARDALDDELAGRIGARTAHGLQALLLGST
jgi:hypothetical protein